MRQQSSASAACRCDDLLKTGYSPGVACRWDHLSWGCGNLDCRDWALYMARSYKAKCNTFWLRHYKQKHQWWLYMTQYDFHSWQVPYSSTRDSVYTRHIVVISWASYQIEFLIFLRSSKSWSAVARPSAKNVFPSPPPPENLTINNKQVST